MENIISIIDFHGQDGIQAVSARALYEYLYPQDSMAHFTRWADKNITGNEFAERGQDWVVFTNSGENPLGGRPAQDYTLRLDFAKKLGMLSRSDRGEEIRDYFIAVEARARQVSMVDQVSRKDLAKWLLESEEAKERLAAALEAAKPKVAFYDAVVADTNWFTLQKAAAELKIPGLGRTTLFQFLRGWEILTSDNVPYRRFIDSGYFCQQPVRTPVGVKMQTMVSQKGVDFILRQWNRHAGAVAV